MKTLLKLSFISLILFSCKKLDKADLELKKNLCKDCTVSINDISEEEGVYKFKYSKNKISFWYDEAFDYDSLFQYYESNLLLLDPTDTLNLQPMCCPVLIDSLVENQAD